MAFSSETSLLILILVSTFTSSQLQELSNLTNSNNTNLCKRCDAISTDCANTSGSFYCKCKPGFAPSLQCQETLDLGLMDGRIQDDSIVVSSYEDNYTKEMLRLNSNGGWCATTTKPGSSYVIIDLKISTIVKGFKTTTVLRHDGKMAYASAVRIQYFDDITDELTDYLSTNGALVEFRLNDPPIIPTYLALPTPITTRYIKFTIHGHVERPCLKLEVMGCTNVQCLDIDECSANNGGCDQICTNDLGGRTCSCEDGFEMVGGGSNKTCLPIECASITPPENGVPIPTKENYQFGDLVKIQCDNGYAPSTSNPILCTSNKTWNSTTTCLRTYSNQTIDATPRVDDHPANCGPFNCTQKYLSAYIAGGAAAFVVLLMVTIMIVWMICSRAKKMTSMDLSLPDYHASNFALAPSIYNDVVQVESRESAYPHYFDDDNDGWHNSTSYVEKYIRGLQTSMNTSAHSGDSAEEDLYTRLKKHAYNGSLREEFVVHI